MRKRRLALIGTVGSDIHSVANHLLEKELLSHGLNVLNLGVAVPVAEWMDVIKAREPEFVLIGSMNGDLEPVLFLLRSICEHKNSTPRKIPDTPLVFVGGNLKLGSEGDPRVEEVESLGATVWKDTSTRFSTIVISILQEKAIKNDSDVNHGPFVRK